MRKEAKTLNKLRLSKMKIASINEQQMLVGGGDRRKRSANSKTGDTGTGQQIQVQIQVQAAIAML